MQIVLRSGRQTWVAGRLTDPPDRLSPGRTFTHTIKYNQYSSDVQPRRLLIEYIDTENNRVGVTLTER